MKFSLLVLCVSVCYSQNSSLPGRTIHILTNRIDTVKRHYDSTKTYYYGRALIDSQTEFFAIQDLNTAEAVAILGTRNLKTREQTILCTLAGVGESSFVYNHTKHLVLFNFEDGLYTFDIRNPLRRDSVTLNASRILDCTNCFEPAWIDSTTITYKMYSGDKRITKQFRLP